MLSLQTIHYLNEKAGKKAKSYGKRPLTFKDKETFQFNVFGIPNLGNYIPRGWELVDRIFVDKTGYGTSNEPAWTLKELKDHGYRGPNYGYAIIEEGECQLYIGVFLPTK